LIQIIFSWSDLLWSGSEDQIKIETLDQMRSDH
jgi:hypothetical protein